MTLFGREPAAWAGLFQALLAVLTTTVLDWDIEQVGTVNAVWAAVLGVYVAYVTNSTMLGVITTLTNAVLALTVAFGVELSEDASLALLTAVPVLAGFFQRTQVSPVGPGNFDLRT